jgi:hypothetical protein
VDSDGATDVDGWFTRLGLRLEVHESDVTGMVRIRPEVPGDELPRFHLTLTERGGHVNRSWYASGDDLDDAKAEARDRYLRELTSCLARRCNGANRHSRW